MRNKPISAKQHRIDTIMGLISGKLMRSAINDRLEINYFDEENIYLMNDKVVDETIYRMREKESCAGHFAVYQNKPK